jgi:hypothetical protein
MAKVKASKASKNIAEIVWAWYENYASGYEFDTDMQFQETDIKEVKAANVDEVWAILEPKLKELVSSYITGHIENNEEEEE